MKPTFLFIAILALVRFSAATEALAHGENKPGPHGGVIRMPGAFHTEIKEKTKSAFDLYVLDIEWKNPVVQGSTLSAKWTSKGKETALVCLPKQKSFLCSLPKGRRFSSGDIVTIQATREGAIGIAVTYEYPFQPTPMGTQGAHDGH